MALFLGGSSVALAQGPSASETGAARQLFEQGLEALAAEDWQAANDAFRRSYELAPRASTLLNLATAQAELGLLVEAVESYRTFIAEATGRARRHRRSARRAVAELEPRLAHMELSIPDLEPGDIVRLDGRDLPDAAQGVPLPMNPGRRHRLTVHRGEHEIGAAELVLLEGETRGVELAIQPPEPVVQDPSLLSDGSRGGDEGVFIGVGVGVGVAVVGAAVVLGIVLAMESGGEAPYAGNLGPGMITF